MLFVGAGPGDPELITVKGQKALMAADVVIYAGSLVPEALLIWAKPEADKLSSASMHLEAIVAEIEKAWLGGKRVVRLHTGDPSLYGAIFEQIVELGKREIPCRVIPGVTAAFAAAAAMGIEYTLPEVSQTLILTRMAGRTPVPEKESLELLAAHQATMAIYLSISLIEEVAATLSEAYGKDAACVVAYRISQPDEKILYSPLEDLVKIVRRENINRQALVIVGNVLEVNIDSLRYKSKLYDGSFAHGFRGKCPEEDSDH